MSDLFLVINDAGAIECVSDAAAGAFGYRADELQGKPLQLVLEVPERPSLTSAPLSWLSAEPNPILHGIHRDGRRFPLRLTQRDIHASTQTHHVLLLQDPAEAIPQSESFLRHRELYELATWHGRISVWEVDYRTNHLEFSPVLGRMLGLADDSIPRTIEGWSKRFHPDDWRLLQSETERMIRREIAELNVECRLIHADGSVVWNLIRGKAFFDPDGRPTKALGTNIDITERKKAEAERDLFFEMSLDLLCIADTSGYFRRVNRAFTKALGYTSEEMTTRPFLDFIHPDDVKPTLKAVAALQAGSDVILFENRYRCKDGSYRWLSWQTPATHAGSSLLYGIARDVTEVKRVQAELQKALQAADDANRAKSEFLSRMSHELRTPLNAILGFGQLLQRDALTDRQREQVGLIVKGGRHLLALINEVLDISRIEVGRLDLSSEPVEILEVVDEVAKLLEPVAAPRAISIHRDPSLQQQIVHADRQRLRQVLINLVSNAIKYNVPRGRVSIRAEATPHDRLHLHVHDEGPGIPREKQHRLFIPFDRLGAEATTVEGSGLGLVLSRRLVEIMGGTLTFTSEPGAGTTFTIDLPLGKLAPHPPSALAQPAPPAPIGGVARTVLCIEDNVTNIRLIEAVLSARPGIRLLVARQSAAGLDLARKHPPDLILLDVHLPDGTGDRVLTDLRADEKLRDIPVIAISADATATQIDRLLSAGAQEYLTKPIDIDQLLRVLDRYLK